MKKSFEEELAEKYSFKGSEAAGKIIGKMLEILGKRTLQYLRSEKELFLASVYGLGKCLASYEVGFKSISITLFYNNLMKMKSGENTDYLLLKIFLTMDLNANVREVKPFHEVLNMLIEKVESKEDLKVLIEFVDATLSYHRYCGGRK